MHDVYTKKIKRTDLLYVIMSASKATFYLAYIHSILMIWNTTGAERAAYLASRMSGNEEITEE